MALVWLFQLREVGKSLPTGVRGEKVAELLGVPVGGFPPSLLKFYDAGPEPFAVALGWAPSGMHGKADVAGVLRQCPGGETLCLCPRKREARSLGALVKGRTALWCYRLATFPQ